MRRIRSWLYLLLAPVVFYGAWRLTGSYFYRHAADEFSVPANEKEREFMPVVARTADGKYIAARLGHLPVGAALVLHVTRRDEAVINRDLSAAIGYPGTAQFFRILTETDSKTEVTLLFPSYKTNRTQSWYALQNRVMEPQRVLYERPGVVIIEGLISLALGATAAVVYVAAIYWFVIRPRQSAKNLAA